MSYWRNAPPLIVPGYKSYHEWLIEEVGMLHGCTSDAIGDIVLSGESAGQLYSRYQMIMAHRIEQARTEEERRSMTKRIDELERKGAT